MRSSDVNAGDSGTIGQYNKLRDDAYASSMFLAHEQSTPDLTLYVEPGAVYFNNKLVEFAGGNSPSFTAPSANPRIDVLSINSSGTLVRTAGTEAASPVAPSLPADHFPICQVYNKTTQTQIYDTDQGSGKGYILKDVRQTMKTLNPLLGGTGADGDLSVSSGTTQIDLAGARILIKNYSSISITGTGKVEFINPHANGTVIIIKCKGNCTLTSSSAPMLDASGCGGQKGTGGVRSTTGGNTHGTAGSSGTTDIGFLTCDQGDASSVGSGAGTAGVFAWVANITSYYQYMVQYMKAFTGGGGGGAQAIYSSGGSGSVIGGDGGRGGGCLILEVGGIMTHTTTNGISVAGKNGGNGSITGSPGSYWAGGGGGGGGGCFLCFYNIAGTLTGTVNVSGGAAGTALAGGAGAGTNGWGGGSATNAGSGSTGGNGLENTILNSYIF